MAEILKNAVIGNRPFWVLTAVSILLIVAGFICPPLGKIDPSVITAIGELIGLGALWAIYAAIVAGRTTTVRHGNTEVTLSDGDNNQ